MSRFYELAQELVKIVDEAQESAAKIDPTVLPERIEHSETLIAQLIWLNAQTLKELAERDGESVYDPPPVIDIVGEVPR